MPSMSYCRFQKLLADLRAVKPHFSDEDLSVDEEAARLKVLRIMAEIVEDHCEEIAEQEEAKNG